VLDELVKEDQKWRQIAYKICGCRFLADDLTQEMYLKVHKYQLKEKKTGYIVTILKYLFLDIRDPKKKTKYDNFSYIDERSTGISDLVSYQNEGVDDADQKILDDFFSLPWFQQELILETEYKSLRQIQRETGINYSYVHAKTKEAREQIFNNGKNTEA
jgi:DNA-directed RNA polymerase specialized sigma24 family protein